MKTKVFTTHNSTKPSQTCLKHPSRSLSIVFLPPLLFIPPPTSNSVTPPPHPPLLAQLRQQEETWKIQRRTSARFTLVFSPLGTDGPHRNVRHSPAQLSFSFPTQIVLINKCYNIKTVIIPKTVSVACFVHILFSVPQIGHVSFA